MVFFGIFLKDGKHYLILSAIVLITASVITSLGHKFLNIDIGITAGMMAGALTSTTILVSAQDALISGLVADLSDDSINIILEKILNRVIFYYFKYMHMYLEICIY